LLYLVQIVYIIIAIAAWFYPDPDVATSNDFEGVVPIARATAQATAQATQAVVQQLIAQ